MKNKDYRLPALPKLPLAPKSAAKARSLRSSGVAKVPAFDTGKVSSVAFGHTAQSSSNGLQPGSVWSNLLSKTTSSNGLAGAFSGVTGFTGGIGSIVSGFESLFGGGGKSAPPALVEYQVPASQRQTYSIENTNPASGSFAGSPAPFEHQSAQIVQAVKQALLNSSALNDVIAEI